MSKLGEAQLQLSRHFEFVKRDIDDVRNFFHTNKKVGASESLLISNILVLIRNRQRLIIAVEPRMQVLEGAKLSTNGQRRFDTSDATKIGMFCLEQLQVEQAIRDNIEERRAPLPIDANPYYGSRMSGLMKAAWVNFEQDAQKRWGGLISWQLK